MELNLYNFEDEEYAESKYVLTSPRSLQACDSLGIKPAKLLYKPLADFQDELLPNNVSLREIYDTYDDHERTRQVKLKECRSFRDRLIRDQLHKMMSPHSANPTSAPHKEYSITSLYDDGYKSADSQGGALSPAELSVTSPKGSASLQRLRTARLLKENSRVSGDPSAIPETDAPVKLAPRPRSVSPSRSVSFLDPSTSPRPQSALAQPVSRSRSPTFTRRRVKSPPYDSFTHRRDHWSHTDGASDRDLSAYLSKSLRVDDLTSWRHPDKSERYLSDRNLRKSLNYSRKTGKVTKHDEKILKALHRKHQNEVDDEIRRSDAAFYRDRERCRSEELRRRSERHRARAKSQQAALAERSLMELRERHAREEAEHRSHMLENCEKNERKWELSSKREQYRQELALREKRKRSLERKRSQERALADFERQREREINKQLVNSDFHQQRASMRKTNQEIIRNMKTQRRNMREEEEHRQRYDRLQRLSDMSRQQLQESLQRKDAVTRLNQSINTSARDKTLYRSTQERERRFRRSRKNLKEKEEEMSEWKRSLLARRRLLESKARLTASQTVELKALRAQAERENRESNHRRTYSRLQEDYEMNRQDQQDAIAYKDTRMKLVQDHKDRVVGKVRSLAATSQRMREELKHKYSKDSFDKIALETELQSRIGRGPHSAEKNKSTVILA